MVKAFIMGGTAHIASPHDDNKDCFCGEECNQSKVDKVVSRSLYIYDFIAYLRKESYVICEECSDELEKIG